MTSFSNLRKRNKKKYPFLFFPMEDFFRMLGKGRNLESFQIFKFLGNGAKRKVDTAWRIIPISKWLITMVIVSPLTLTKWDDPPSGTKFNNQINFITRNFEETDSTFGHISRDKIPSSRVGFVLKVSRLKISKGKHVPGKKSITKT